jgi:hypothetical protein
MNAPNRLTSFAPGFGCDLRDLLVMWGRRESKERFHGPILIGLQRPLHAARRTSLLVVEREPSTARWLIERLLATPASLAL